MTPDEVYNLLVTNGQTDADASSGAAYAFWVARYDHVPEIEFKVNTLKLLSNHISSVYKQ